MKGGCSRQRGEPIIVFWYGCTEAIAAPPNVWEDYGIHITRTHTQQQEGLSLCVGIHSAEGALQWLLRSVS